MVKMNRASLSTWCLYSGGNAGEEKIQYLLSRGLCQLALKDRKPLLHENHVYMHVTLKYLEVP